MTDMKKLYIVTALSFLIYGVSFAQTNEEKSEKRLTINRIAKSATAPMTYSTVEQSAGYDSNVFLSPDGKGSLFEETLYSFGLHKPFRAKAGFTFHYDIDYLNYNTASAASNLLNHMRTGFYKKSGPFLVGAGYDFTYSYYPNDSEGDFFFHKGFIYARHYVTRRLYHQLLAEYGYKPHTSAKALGTGISVLQDEARKEKRSALEYAVAYTPVKKLFLDIRARFSKNDANDIYLDFGDYKSYEFSPGLRYALTARMDLLSNFIYVRKAYKSRTVSSGTDREKDSIYAANASLRYKLNAKNSASFNYSYRDNASNDDLQGYTENLFSIGWQYSF